MATKSTNLANLLLLSGGLFLLSSLSILAVTYLPLAKQEVIYELKQKSAKPEIEVTPVNTDFGLVIRKIGANAAVIANVDPFNSREYQTALSRGIAHAKGTALPDQPGNVFLFSHISADFLTATRYNSVFYLLDKLIPGDQVELYYQGKKYIYDLTKKVIASPEEISYLTGDSNKQTLTLMTCWPTGTSLKRLIWQAELAP